MIKTKKVNIALILIVTIIMGFSVISYGSIATNDFKPEDPENYETAIEKIAPVIKIILSIGIIIGVIGITILGLRYMLGSANEKAEYKETMMPFLFGAIFMFSISAILRLIASLF